jgi:serine/threonine protein kinase
VRKTQADIADVLKEVELLKKLNHVYDFLFFLRPALTCLTQPNISAIYDFESVGEQLYVTGCGNALPLRHSGRHIFLELATGGDLFSYMVKNGTLCEGEAKFISYQLMKGLEV